MPSARSTTLLLIVRVTLGLSVVLFQVSGQVTCPLTSVTVPCCLNSSMPKHGRNIALRAQDLFPKASRRICSANQCLLRYLGSSQVEPAAQFYHHGGPADRPGADAALCSRRNGSTVQAADGDHQIRVGSTPPSANGVHQTHTG